MQHYNIAAINVYTGKRRVITLKGDLPREEVKREVDAMNGELPNAFHYTLTTEGV